MSKVKLTLIKTFPQQGNNFVETSTVPGYVAVKQRLKAVVCEPKIPLKNSLRPETLVTLMVDSTADMLESTTVLDFQQWATLQEYNQYILNHGTGNQKLDQLAFLAQYGNPDPYSKFGSLKEDFIRTLEDEMHQTTLPETYQQVCHKFACHHQPQGWLGQIKAFFFRLFSPHPTFGLPPRFYQTLHYQDDLSWKHLSGKDLTAFKQQAWDRELAEEYQSLNGAKGNYDKAHKRFLTMLWNERTHVTRALRDHVKVLARVNFLRQKFNSQQYLVDLLQKEYNRLFSKSRHS